MSNQAHALILATLSFLLVFRSTLSYNRYWQGNVELGGLQKGARELMSQLCSFIDDPEGREASNRKLNQYRRLINIQFASIRMHLQSQTARMEFQPDNVCAKLRDLRYMVDLTEQERRDLLLTRNRPLVVVTWIRQLMIQHVNDKSLSVQYLKQMSPNITVLITSWMNCERIIKTPFVFPYAQMVSIFLFAFCLTLPFTLVETFGVYTALPATLVSFALFGINYIGIEIENPFGGDSNDLPIREIEEEIAQDLLDIVKVCDPDAKMVKHYNEDIAIAEDQSLSTQSSGKVSPAVAAQSNPSQYPATSPVNDVQMQQLHMQFMQQQMAAQQIGSAQGFPGAPMKLPPIQHNAAAQPLAPQFAAPTPQQQYYQQGSCQPMQ